MQEIIYNWIWDRIDVYLANNFSYSRSFFHHIFDRDWILVNGKIVKKSYKLKNNDKIQIDDLERYLWPVILEEAPKIDLPIKLDKEDYLIIYKPKWVLSHPNSVWDVRSPSVVGFLYHKFKNLPTIWNFIRAWLIHRLDKETDGFMIIAKTEKWLEYFKKLFNKKSESSTIEDKENVQLKKFYKAEIFVNKDNESLLRSMVFPYIIVEPVIPKVPYYWEPKIGITKILWVDFLDNRAILNIEILTWRTHQIRYHLSSRWLPIIWDYLYGWGDDEEMKLTAYRLEFLDLYWEYIKLEL